MNKKRVEEFKSKYTSYYLTNKDDIFSRTQKNEALLFSFLNSFSIEKLTSMQIDDYCFEKGNKDTFCYWFDYQLNDLCDIHIKKTGAFQKYHIQRDGTEYKYLKKRQKNNKFGSNPEEIFKNVKHEIIKIAKASKSLTGQNIAIIKESKLHESFKAKITYVYSPDNWVPILVENDVNIILDWFGVDYTKADNLTDKRIKLFDIFLTIVKTGVNFSTWDFMRFFYNENGLRSLLRGEKKKDHLLNKRISNRKKSYDGKRDVNDLSIETLSSIELSDNLYSEDSDFDDEIDYEKRERIKRQVGKEGEIIVFYYLKKNKNSLGINKIKTPGLDGKNYFHYDISYFKNGIQHFIEVKATCSSSDQRIYFEMSKNEYSFMHEHLDDGLYEVYYVQNVFGKPRIYVVEPKQLYDKMKPSSYYLKGKL